MPQSRTEFYYHFVWATWRRSKFITSDIERRLHRCIESECRKLNAVVYAIDGIEDHVHLVVQLPAILAPVRIMQRSKGISSTFARQQLVKGGLFGWQDGYGGFTVSKEALPAVIAYVRNQKRHHAEGTTIPEWEDCGPSEDEPPSPPEDELGE